MWDSCPETQVLKHNKNLNIMNVFIQLIMSLFVNTTLTVTSPSFKANDTIPARFSCDGANISPGLNIAGLPNNTQTMALIVDDPDAPNTFDHWLIWDMPVMREIKENTAPGTQGNNDAKESKYTGPCPPAGTGVHHYHFKVYALDTKLELKAGTKKKELLKAMEGHILAEGEIVGLFKR
jgi:Raf kinase inhibitor-like YbhB/YbcL family protein